MERADHVVIVPELDGIKIASGHPITFENLETDKPQMRIGSVLFEGQYQQYIGTALVVGMPTSTSARPMGDVQSLTQRRIVMRLASGTISSLLSPPSGAGSS